MYSLSLSLCSNGHFPGGHGLADTRMSPLWILLELRMTEVVKTTGAIRCTKLQSKCRHQQTNTQFFTGWMPFLSSNQQCQSTERKCSLSVFTENCYSWHTKVAVLDTVPTCTSQHQASRTSVSSDCCCTSYCTDMYLTTSSQQNLGDRKSVV